MNNSLTIEKTQILQHNDKQILISTLPESIRFEIETWDRYRQDRLNCAYELEKIELALKLKSMMITNMMDSQFKQSEVGGEADAK